MKKYILSLFTVLVLGLLIVPSFSFAQVGDVDPNPTATDCVALQNNLRYRDRDINKNGEVSTLQDFLQSKGYLNSEPTGYFGLLTFKAVKDFQKANDISPTGYVGPITRAKIKALTCDGITSGSATLIIKEDSIPNNSQDFSFVVKGVSSETGVSNYVQNFILDDDQSSTTSNIKTLQLIPGTYKISQSKVDNWDIFASYLKKDVDEDILENSTDGNLYVDIGAGKSLTVSYINRLTTSTTPSITVLSPNGGETYTAGQQITVKWNSKYIGSNEKISVSIYKKGAQLSQEGSPYGYTTTNIGSYNWIIPKDINSNQYEVSVGYILTNGNAVYDNSDNYFTITSSATIPPFPEGCTSVAGYSMTTGLPCYVETVSITSLTSTSAVLNGYLFRGIPTNVNFAYYKSGTPQIDTQSVLQMNNGPFSATVSNLTPNTLYYFYACATTCARRLEFTTPPSTSGPVISGISGPQSLNVGQQGTWTIKASDKSNGTLNYSVVWGDEIYPLSSTASNLSIKETRSQSATFTHTYNEGGTYFPLFTVTNESGQSASASLSVNVGTETSTNAKPVLNLIAVPESVNVGQSVNFNFSATDADNDDLSWSVSWGNVGGGGACGYPHRQNGANWTYSTNHTWDMAGTYDVKVSVSDCRDGTASTSFSIRVTDVDLAPPVISSISGPQLLKVGEQGKWEIKASDSIKTAQLLYSVVWGDEAITGVPITASNDIKLVGQTATFTHTYNTPGIYQPEFEVSRVIMCLIAPCPNGPSAKASLSVDVRGIAIKNSVSLNSALESQSANVLGAVTSCAGFTMTLRMGMNNPEVKCLQKMLNEKSFKVEGVETGGGTTYFGLATLTALKAFQSSNNLTVDGIFGPNTRIALEKQD